MFVCLLLAVLLLFHTNSSSFSFLLESLLILIFTNKSQDWCLFKMPLAFFTPWPDPAAVNGAAAVSISSGYSPKHDFSGRWPQNTVTFPEHQTKMKRCPSLSSKDTETNQYHFAQIYSRVEGRIMLKAKQKRNFSLYFSVGGSWKCSWYITNAGS